MSKLTETVLSVIVIRGGRRVRAESAALPVDVAELRSVGYSRECQRYERWKGMTLLTTGMFNTSDIVEVIVGTRKGTWFEREFSLLMNGNRA